LPGGAVVLVHTLSDNKLRIQQQVRDTIERHGGHLGSVGSVHYMFAQKGEIIFKSQISNPKSQEELELQIIDLGIEDVEIGGDTWIVFCDPKKTFEIRQGLEKMGLQVELAQLIMKPTILVPVTDPAKLAAIEETLSNLTDLDDVQNVFTNYA